MSCPDETALTLFLSGGLSEDEAASVDLHIDACEECFELLAVLAGSRTPTAGAWRASRSESTSHSPPPRLRRGARVGRYVLLELVGVGGTGSVYAAADPELGRTIALKLVHIAGAAPDSVAVEARMMAQLSHPNVVPVHDVGAHDDFVFIAMELIDGSNLRSWLEREKRPWRDVVAVFVAAARGLGAAHKVGLVHRDFKPDNVLVGRDGRVVVTDFGLAQSARSTAGVAAGTPAYMAPEQFRAAPVDPRADQFAFCVALFEALHAKRPFSASDRTAQAAPAIDRRIPRWLRRVILRGLSPSVDDRWASMDVVIAALERDRRRPWRRGLAAAAVVSTLATALVAYRVHTAPERACVDAVPEQLAGVWDAERRSAIHRAFLATSEASRAEVFANVAESVDTYAAAWSAMRVESCDATYGRHEQSAKLFDLRATCLNERLAELRAMTSFFAAADDGVVRNATSAARSLTPIGACGDARALLAISPPPPDVAAEVARLRREIARAKAARDAGKPSEALALLVRVAEESASTGYRPLEALALLQLGDAQLAGGDGASADATLVRAVQLADAAKDDVLRARALARQIYASGYMLEQFERAADLDAQSTFVIERIGGDDELEGDRLQAIGMVRLAARDFAGAGERLSKAIALREKVFGPRSRRVAMSTNSLCLVGMAKAEWAEALPGCERALGIWRESLGPRHPDTAWALKNVGRISFELGRVDEGCRQIEEALSIEEASLDREHPHIAASLTSLGECAAARHDDARAAELYARAVEVRERGSGASHAKTAEALVRLGRAYLASGDGGRARPALERAQALEDERTDPVLRATTAIALAQVASPKTAPDEQARARDLGGASRELCRSSEGEQRRACDDVEAWLRAHPDVSGRADERLRR